MKIRKQPMVLLLLVTVLAPIVLFTDRLSMTISTIGGNEFADEVSTIEKTPATLQEPSGIIYYSLVDSSSNTSFSNGDVTSTELINSTNNTKGDNSRRIRQLAEESVVSTVFTSAGGTRDQGGRQENSIQLVTEHGGLEVNQSAVTSSRYETTGNNEKASLEMQDSSKGERGEIFLESLQNPNGGASLKLEKDHDERPGKAYTKHGKAYTKHGKAYAKNGKGEPRKTKAERQKEQTVVLPDARIRQLKDQLIRARVYLSLAATRSNPHFMRELRLRMKEVQRVLGDASKDSDLPRNAYEKLKAMEQTLVKGNQIQDDCTAMVKKLRAMIHTTEEQLRVHKKQTLFLTHLTAKTVPKGLHCLPLRLSTEYFSLKSSERNLPGHDKIEDPSLYHYALFTDNVLAAAVVVNSTVSRARDPFKHVFHIVTDRLNYAAMKMWFLANPPGRATIQVQNIEEFTWLNSSYSPVLEQLGSPSMVDYYFKIRHADSDSNMKYRNPKYLSIMNHLRFYMPEIFPKLNKVLFLDDDIVVQKDLTALWSLDPKGKVIGVVETCGESFHRFDRYLNFSNALIASNFNPRACGWAFGMNIFDLEEWRRQNITGVYHSWQNLNHDRQLWKLGTLPPGLITFWNHTFLLDRSWHVLGLGYNPNVSQKEIEQAAVIHYNGNLKPWLEIGIPKYKSYWARYVDYDNSHLRECNINP